MTRLAKILVLLGVVIATPVVTLQAPETEPRATAPLSNVVVLFAVGTVISLAAVVLSRRRREPPAVTGGRLADLMAVAYARRTGSVSALLFLGLAATTVIAYRVRSNDVTLTALILGVLYLLASVKQFVLTYRIQHSLFGRDDYEVRQLIRFVLRHSQPEDFGSGGRPRPAFDVGQEELAMTVTPTGAKA